MKGNIEHPRLRKPYKSSGDASECTWSKSCSQLLLCVVIRAFEAATLDSTRSVRRMSQPLSRPGRRDAVMKST